MSNHNQEQHETACTSNGVENHLKINDSTLTKTEQEALLRSILPAVNGQEGSPANTFTSSELQDLQQAVGRISVGPSSSKFNNNYHRKSKSCSINTIDIRYFQASFQQPPANPSFVYACPQDGGEEAALDESCPQNGAFEEFVPLEQLKTDRAHSTALDWHGAPRLHKDHHLPQSFREQVRNGLFTSPTNGVCPGFLQCNLVVLPQGPIAFDFLLFCQRNPKACPLIEVCDVGSPHPHGVAPGADLRTDVPK